MIVVHSRACSPSYLLILLLLCSWRVRLATNGRVLKFLGVRLICVCSIARRNRGLLFVLRLRCRSGLRLLTNLLSDAEGREDAPEQIIRREFTGDLGEALLSLP